MSAPTIRQRLEAILLVAPWPAMSLERIYQELPDCTHDQVRDGLGYLRKLGLIVQHGTTARPIYQGVMGATAQPDPAPAQPNQPKAPVRAIIWPAGLQVQVAPPSNLGARGTWSGINWAHATQRPGCQDHLLHPSRRGDQLVPHQAQLSGCVGELRDKRSNGR